MKKTLHLALVLGLAAFVFSPSAHASVMGICTDWVPESSSYCTQATPSLDIGTTGSTNPTFNIALNGSGSSDSTELLVLIPTSDGISNLTFSASFTPEGEAPVSATLYSNPLSTPFTSGYVLADYLGLTVKDPGVDYHFNSINGVEAVSGNTGFSVYLFQSSIPLTAGSGYVSVSFSNFMNGSGFPYGTIFLALGNDSGGKIIYNTPLTIGLEDTVPEPMSLILFGTGLLGIALMVRFRTRKEARGEDAGDTPASA